MRLLYNMKFAAALLAAAMLAASCAKDNPKDVTAKAKACNWFKASTSATQVTSDMDTLILTVESNVEWTLKVSEGLEPSATEGEGDASILIIVPENTTFSSRSFNYSISTEEELDVDDPAIFTKFGDTLSFSLTQAGMVQKFSVDSDSLKVASTSVSAMVTLTSNIAYGVSCQGDVLSCRVEDDTDNPNLHYLNFSFPANQTEEAIYYKATVTPASESFEPITVVIRQSGYRKIVIDCTNAANYRYDKGGTPTAFPTSSHGTAFVEDVDFWLVNYESYIFHGSVKNWGGTLNAAAKSPVKLPLIEGFQLLEVNVTYSKASKLYTYSVTDGTNTLGSCQRISTSTEETKIDLANPAVTPVSAERYLVCSNEMCVKFILTYVSVD